MNLLVKSTCLICLIGAGFGAALGAPQDSGQAQVVTAAAVVERCLQNPNRDCALAAALMVTAEEQLAIARADTLAAVADTFQRLGQTQRARETLALARQAAEDIGLTLATEQKLAEMAAIHAAMGDDDTAIATAEALSDRFLAANTLGAIALAQARTGRFVDAERTLERIDLPLLALKYALELSEEAAERSGADGVALGRLEARIETIENAALRALGHARLSMLHARNGDAETAQRYRELAAEPLATLNSTVDRARLFSTLARADLALGDRQAYERNVQQAYRAATFLFSGYDQTLAFGEVITALAVGGRIDEAVALMEKVEEPRARSALIERLAGRSAAASAIAPLATQVLESAAEEESRSERDGARLAAAAAFAEVGATDRAVDVIAAIESDDRQARALAFLARALE